jgi:hypothetical protein
MLVSVDVRIAWDISRLLNSELFFKFEPAPRILGPVRRRLWFFWPHPHISRNTRPASFFGRRLKTPNTVRSQLLCTGRRNPLLAH